VNPSVIPASSPARTMATRLWRKIARANRPDRGWPSSPVASQHRPDDLARSAPAPGSRAGATGKAASETSMGTARARAGSGRRRLPVGRRHRPGHPPQLVAATCLPARRASRRSRGVPSGAGSASRPPLPREPQSSSPRPPGSGRPRPGGRSTSQDDWKEAITLAARIVLAFAETITARRPSPDLADGRHGERDEDAERK